VTPPLTCTGALRAPSRSAQARGEVRLPRSSAITTPDASIGRLITQAYGSPERLRDAAALLDPDNDREALALLTRAHRLSQYPVNDPPPPKPFSPPAAPGPQR
jgi:hypothetical protein